MKETPFEANYLPVNKEYININIFIDELIDATSKFEVYKEKIKDSKLDSSWFLPTLQQKEALASSQLEGTQATIDGVLSNQVSPNDKSKDLNMVENYLRATNLGYRILRKEEFSVQLIKDLHESLMIGNVRRTSEEIGCFRKKQNYIGKTGDDHAITFVPPAPENVEKLMGNLIDYIVKNDEYRPLVQLAIIHAQLETIHPFMDGNGRVGRIMIPLYLYYKNEIEFPCFFISEALEKDKMRYYKLLNDIREKNAWSEWIKFFLQTVSEQCDKYIKIIGRINKLYDNDLKKACEIINSSQVTDLMNLLYQYPVINSEIIVSKTKIPRTTVNRYLSKLVEYKILDSNNKARNRTYFYYDLMKIIRE